MICLFLNDEPMDCLDRALALLDNLEYKIVGVER